MNDQRIKPQFISVPFKADSPNGVTEYDGIAKFSPAGIVVEYKSMIIGLIPGDVKEVQIPLNEILDIKFRPGFYKFFSRIQLRLLNFATISRLPNSGGKIKLKIKREDFELAQKAVEQTLNYLKIGSDMQIRAINDNELTVNNSPRPLFDQSEDTTRNLSD